MAEVTDPVSAPPRPPDRIERSRKVTSDRLALWSFVALVVVAGPLILFHLGAYHWFLLDEFAFLTDRGLADLGRPHSGTHLSVVPRLVYLGLWQLFGLNTYLPYQACVVALHLAGAVLLRLVMRRAGVNPWLATAAAASMVLFGPGAQNIVWAFQIGLTGSLTYGLAHLLLADHDGPFQRRDLLGLAFGLLAVLSSGVGVVMVAVVGAAVLWSRGWRSALTHTLPLGLVYGIWAVAWGASSESPLGRPTPGALVDFIRSSVIGTFLGLGHFQVIAGLLALLLVAGVALIVRRLPEGGRRDGSRPLAPATALFLGGIAFFAITGYGRWYVEAEGARASRYLYLGAAFSLPLLAVAAQEVATRWRVVTPVLALLFLVPVPFNLDAFEQRPFDSEFMSKRRTLLTSAVRMPFARDVPADTSLFPTAFENDGLTIGFLLDAEQQGRLTPSQGPIPLDLVDELEVRLGIATAPAELPESGCRKFEGALELSPDEGDTFAIRDQVLISTVGPTGTPGPPVTFDGGSKNNQLTIVLDDLDLLIRPAPPSGSFTLCAGS